MGELPTVELPVKTGTVPEVPEPVTCAAELIANAAIQSATDTILPFIIAPTLSS
jgi:hypothetical protein